MNEKEYYHNYYLEHMKEIKKRNHEYYIEYKNELSEKHKEYQENNRERIRVYRKEYRLKNREKILAEGKEYRLNNRDKLRNDAKDYRKEHLEEHRLNNKNRVIERRLYYIKLLGEKCQRCGENDKDVLEFHHKILVKRKWRDSNKGSWMKPAFKEAVEKDEIMLLCANCHRKEHRSF